MAVAYDGNALDGYEVYCDGCDAVLGWAADEPAGLTLCNTCTPRCCTSDRLLEVGGYNHILQERLQEEKDEALAASAYDYIEPPSIEELPF